MRHRVTLSQIAKSMGPTWGPLVGPMDLAIRGIGCCGDRRHPSHKFQTCNPAKSDINNQHVDGIKQMRHRASGRAKAKSGFRLHTGSVLMEKNRQAARYELQGTK